MSDRPMTSLLVAVREDAEVVKCRGGAYAFAFVAYDRALGRAAVRAAVREIARRVREQAAQHIETQRDGMMIAADLVEGMTE